MDKSSRVIGTLNNDTFVTGFRFFMGYYLIESESLVAKS